MATVDGEGEPEAVIEGVGTTAATATTEGVTFWSGLGA